MNSFRKTFILVAVLVAIIGLDAVYIESKLDGYVLTISEQKVPPGGPYERNGVLLRPAGNTLQQQWGFDESAQPNQVTIGTHSEYFWNAISTGLAFDNGFAYTYVYDIGNVTSDGFRLLRTVNRFAGPNVCVKNPGNGGFHQEVECNLDDDSQLWRFYS